MTEIQLNAQQDVSTDDSAAPIEEPEASSFTLAELLGDPAEVIVHDRTITVNGQLMRFHIRQLSTKECTEVEAKKYKFDQFGRVARDIAAEETRGAAWLLHRCLVKQYAEAPNWTPLWSIEEIVGGSSEFDAKGNLVHQRPGLMDNSGQAANDLIADLVFACWEINPTLSPLGRESEQTP